MTDIPKMQLSAFAVTLVYGTGPVVLRTLVAPSEQLAIAMAMDAYTRDHGAPQERITGVVAIPLPLEWLRAAARAVETGEPGGQVVSLVPQIPHPEAEEAAKKLDDARRGIWHPPLSDGK
jgi:hypothetical protein